MELPGRRTAVAQAFSPLRGNRVPTVYGANERPADGRIGVGVSAAHDGVDHGFLQILRMEELPEGVVKRRQNPTLLTDVVGGRGGSGTSDGTKDAIMHIHVFGPGCDPLIEVPRIAGSTNGLGNRHSIQRVGLPADRMRMSERRILSSPVSHLCQVMVGAEDTHWTDPHHRVVGLAVRIGASTQTAGNCHSAIEGTRVEPEDISLPSLLGVVSALVCQQTGQQQRHLGIIRWLSGDCVPGPSVNEIPNTIGMFLQNMLWCLELHQAA